MEGLPDVITDFHEDLASRVGLRSQAEASRSRSFLAYSKAIVRYSSRVRPRGNL